MTRRLLGVIPAALGISLLGFLLVHLVPGDPAVAFLGERATPEAVAALRTELGLDRSLPIQMSRYASRLLLHGDLGISLRTRNPVAGDLRRAFPATLELALAAMLLACLVGIPLGVTAALKPGSWRDLAASAFSVTGLSLPVFWVGLVLAWALGVHGGLPFDARLSADREVPFITGLMLLDALGQPAAWWDALRHLMLPAVTLSIVPMAMLARMTRAQMRETLSEPFILAARAKGLSPSRILWRHAFPNALLPILTTAGLQAGTLLGGAALTETVFSWPGLGRYLVDAVGSRDFPALQGALLVTAAAFLLVNLAVDLGYAWVDPRLRRPAGASA
jgi:peptide/nickel transport system permease protein